MRLALTAAVALATLPACGPAPYRTSRIEARARDRDHGTVYFVEVRRGRQVPNGTGDDLDTPDEISAVIACNDRTPQVCVRIVPDTLTADEARAWSQALNVVVAAQECAEAHRDE